MSGTIKFPRLDFTFVERDGKLELAEAWFQLNEPTSASDLLIRKPPGGPTFRALCILMLLAKYARNDFVKDGKIEFVHACDKSNWLQTLGQNFGRLKRQAFCKTYFNELQFLGMERGSAQNKGRPHKGLSPKWPIGIFHDDMLSLSNLEFSKIPSLTERKKKTPIEGKELYRAAMNIESQNNGWTPIVESMALELDKRRPKRRTTAAPAKSIPDSESFILSANWRELNKLVYDDAQKNLRGGDWYFVCVTPSWLSTWKTFLLDDVSDHGATIRIASHAPDAADNCHAIAAQWKMHIGFFDAEKPYSESKNDRIAIVRNKLNSFDSEKMAWPPKTPMSKGGFEYYHSRIAPPFIGALSVAKRSNKKWQLGEKAPEGTWCFLGLHPLYLANMHHRCGLYLKGASPVLDIYYNSILRFFQDGVRDGYLYQPGSNFKSRGNP